MEIILISAVGRGPDGKYNVIGKNNELPWDFREFKRDMNRFKELTTGHTVLMGRKTFESIGSRPLPKRTNLVVSRSKIDNEKIVAHNSIENAIAHWQASSSTQNLFIIGGQTIYEQCMRYATKILLTHIDKDADGDVFFPEIASCWEITNEEKEFTEGVKFVEYVRQNQA